MSVPPGPQPTSVPLTAVRRLSPGEQSRGLVRVAPTVLTGLGAAHLDVVRIEGARTTAALVAAAPPGTPADLLLCDELMLANTGLPDGGGPVRLSHVPTVLASELVLGGPPEVLAALDVALVRSLLHGKAVTTGDLVSLLPHDLAGAAGGDAGEAARTARVRLMHQATTARLTVLRVVPEGPVLCGPATRVSWGDGPAPSRPFTAAPPPAQSAPPARLEDLPGLETQAARLHEWWDLGFSHPDLLARLGTAPQMGVLLSGPDGSGKTTLVRAVAAGLGVPVHALSGTELAAQVPDQAAAQLRAVLPGSAPAVVLLEQVEALAPREGSSPLLPTLLAALRAAVAGGRTAVVCTTSRPETVSPALTGPGLLDHELAVPLPDRAGRLRVLEVLSRGVPLEAAVSLDDVAARTPGFVAEDLRALLRAAGLQAAARQREAEHPVVGPADLDAALGTVRASSAEGALATGTLSLEDVGDMVETKAALTEAVLWPLRYPDTFATLGVSAPRGVLLYGPPGCGKTFLVRALAGSGEATVLAVKGAELLSKWVGDSELAVRELFRRARSSAPTLIFLDEVDALAPVRGGGNDGGTTDRVVAALLTELDGMEALRDVVVVAATNRPDRIDPALLRPGRLERLVYVPPPDTEARVAILRATSRSVPLADDVDLEALGPRTEGFSAADCAALVREAALTAMRTSLAATSVSAAHMEAALAVVRPSLDPAQVAALESYAERREG